MTDTEAIDIIDLAAQKLNEVDDTNFIGGIEAIEAFMEVVSNTLDAVRPEND